MPRYFFDVDLGTRRCRDRRGIDLTSADDVPSEASMLLVDLFCYDFSRVSRIISVDVSDRSGAVVYRATLTGTIRHI